MKKIVAILVVIAILLLSMGSVMAGGDKNQILNPSHNDQDQVSDHWEISHCFKNVVD